uniref:Uncharacterized protein n=1 Tax=Grammatophora oceanica TaxID=210454 RepID=A0A7S1Y2M7_9STRA|mmetsp:Transcript_18816/g.27835  ORF Transcript_18816/g.27835 Transcript_18816/m.27835 type:complete len:304 (+) Transcript_18816:114-1025(+)
MDFGEAQRYEMNRDRAALFINIVVNDASAAVQQQVEESFMQGRVRLVPRAIKKRLAQNAGRVASDLVTPAKLVEKMGPKLEAEIPKILAEKGLTVHLNLVFREANFMVLALQVICVDVVKLSKTTKQKTHHSTRRSNNSNSVILENNNNNRSTNSRVHAGPNAALSADPSKKQKAIASVTAPQKPHTTLTNLFGWGMSLIGNQHRIYIEQELLPQILQRRIKSQMGDFMKGKFARKKLQADVIVKREEQQARFFYVKLREVQLDAASTKANRRLLPRWSCKNKKGVGVPPDYLSEAPTMNATL